MKRGAAAADDNDDDGDGDPRSGRRSSRRRLVVVVGHGPGKKKVGSGCNHLLRVVIMQHERCKLKWQRMREIAA